MLDDTWEDWKRRHDAKQAQAWQKLKKYEESLSSVKRPATEREKQGIAALQKCTFQVGSWDKRFVHGLEGSTEISEKQSYWLAKMVYRYRRQLGLTPEQAKSYFQSEPK